MLINWAKQVGDWFFGYLIMIPLFIFGVYLSLMLGSGLGLGMFVGAGLGTTPLLWRIIYVDRQNKKREGK